MPVVVSTNTYSDKYSLNVLFRVLILSTKSTKIGLPRIIMIPQYLLRWFIYTNCIPVVAFSTKTTSSGSAFINSLIHFLASSFFNLRFWRNHRSGKQFISSMFLHKYKFELWVSIQGVQKTLILTLFQLYLLQSVLLAWVQENI